MGLCFCIEVVLQFRLGASFSVRQVLDHHAFFEEGDAGGDVDGVLQVVGGDENSGSSLLIIIGEHVFEDVLRRGIEEVEGLVEDH